MHNNPYGLIYKVTNSINDKIYIGQTTGTLHKRQLKHESGSRKRKPPIHFHRALKKYSIEAFTWKILDYCDDKIELNDLEYHYIMQFDSYKNGYNQTLGWEGSCGRICKDSTKEKISKAKTGIPLSKEHKAKLSKMRRGVKKSPEHVKNVARAKSQYWEIIHPNGNKEVIRNLSAFCRSHNLSDRGMWLVANKYRIHHKSFKCKKLSKK
jgi:group I intron endonuclease